MHRCYFYCFLLDFVAMFWLDILYIVVHIVVATHCVPYLLATLQKIIGCFAKLCQNAQRTKLSWEGFAKPAI